MESLFRPGSIFTLGEVARTLKVSRVTLIRSIERGQLRAFRVGIQWRLLGRDLNAYLHLDGRETDQEIL